MGATSGHAVVYGEAIVGEKVKANLVVSEAPAEKKEKVIPTNKEIDEFISNGGAKGYACTAEAIAVHFGLRYEIEEVEDFTFGFEEYLESIV